ncbi:MAG: hypothetical protein ACR2RD_16600 [Woeseiaceae bacterium]
MTLLPLDDPKWKDYRGGYNSAVYDLVPFLTKLRSLEMSEKDWNILWEDLHHQGDIGEASYAVVPYLTEYAKSARKIAWHVFGFAAIVELERTEHDNPEVPEEIRDSYFASIKELPKIALERGADVWGKDCFECVMACLALSLEYREHARAYLDLTESEIPEFYKYYHGTTD